MIVDCAECDGSGYDLELLDEEGLHEPCYECGGCGAFCDDCGEEADFCACPDYD